VAFLRERQAEPVTLADLADEVHLSVYHLVRVFRTATGQTPHRFLTELRGRGSEALLRSSRNAGSPTKERRTLR
jgi:AraC family transcriptional regulator